MTAKLSGHVQNFIAITSLQCVWERNQISIEFDLQWKIRLWNGPLFHKNIENCSFVIETVHPTHIKTSAAPKCTDGHY